MKLDEFLSGKNGLLGLLNMTTPQPVNFLASGVDRFGRRQDGSMKGLGFFGELQRPDGDVSTELSAGVDFGNGEQEIPLLVPTLSRLQINHLLGGGDPTQAILDKAYENALRRIGKGLSPFAGNGERAPLPLLGQPIK